MKFGKTLPSHQVPEWSSNYINYKELKRLVKKIATEKRNGQDPDRAPFFFAFDRSIEDVDAFYNRRLAAAQRRLKLLRGRFEDHFDLSNLDEAAPGNGTNGIANAIGFEHDAKSKKEPEGWGLDRDEVSELLSALLEVRGGLRNLQWYGEINRRGFIKILKKYDKKTGSEIKEQYFESKVSMKPFASGSGIQSTMNAVNNWLSKIGDVESFADEESSRASSTDMAQRPGIKRVSSGAAAGLSPSVIAKIEECIRENNGDQLKEIISEERNKFSSKLVLNLLQRAITHRAAECVLILLNETDSLTEEDDINDRNILHRLVIAIGRIKGQTLAPTTSADVTNEPENASLKVVPTRIFIKPAQSPQSAPPKSSQPEYDGQLRLSPDDEAVKMLEYILLNLQASQREAITQRDSYGRMPLHYAAQYGFVVICRLLIRFMKEWDQFDVLDGIDSPKWQDADGYAPLHLAVIAEHPKTTRTLLQAETGDGKVGTSEQATTARKLVSKSSAVLIMAAKRNSVEIVKLLVEAGVDINYQDESGDTALHHAARLGHVDCVKALLSGGDGQIADVELPEKQYGWTPLFIAAVEGNYEVAEVLIDLGHCEIDKVDTSGWTPAEHAALRGHIALSKMLIARCPAASGIGRPLGPPEQVYSSTEKNNSNASLSGSLNATGSGAQTTIQQDLKSVKSFGHRYLKKEQNMVLVTLGSTDTRKNIHPVDLDQIPVSDAHTTLLDTALSLVVSAQNATGEPTIVDLPVHSNVAAEDPISFETDDPKKVKLIFDIVPTYAGSNKRIIGRAVAMLGSIKNFFGKEKTRTAMSGNITVPILSVSTLDVIGSVNFEFLVVTPFDHPNVGVTKEHTYWKSMSLPRVIGHRGIISQQRIPDSLGENTMLSFITAAKLGAEYVEFDVQLTKDHVPVIYHDFLVGETGIDAPVHTLTLEQFMSMKEDFPKSRNTSPDRNWDKPKGSDSPTSNGGSSNGQSPETAASNPPSNARRIRSMSLSIQGEDHHENMRERMKHTRAFKKNGFKGNTRGASIQGPFVTLEQLFKELPTSIGFNIELKYPMLQETEEEEMDPTVIEPNAWIDAVLRVVHDHGLSSGRNMIFSSFNPDICLILSFKQPSIPILYLTEGGTAMRSDVRASSLQEAIRFASRWNLLGIVSAAEPLVTCPRLIRVVKETGLVCVTYGTLNNQAENVRLQVEQGIDALIVDSVLTVDRAVRTEDHGAGKKKVQIQAPGIVPVKDNEVVEDVLKNGDVPAARAVEGCA